MQITEIAEDLLSKTSLSTRMTLSDLLKVDEAQAQISVQSYGYTMKPEAQIRMDQKLKEARQNIRECRGSNNLTEAQAAKIYELIDEALSYITPICPYTPGVILISYNSRLRSTMGRLMQSQMTSYRKAKKKIDSLYYILEVSPQFMQLGSRQAKRDVIAHEIIHTVTGCFNHSPLFKVIAAQLNGMRLGYYIQTKFSYSNYDNLERPERKLAKYAVVCQICGKQITRMKKSRVITHPEKYRCPYCGGKLKAYELRYSNTEG